LNGASGLPGILGFGYAWRADVWMSSLLDRRPWNSAIYFSGMIVGSILGTALSIYRKTGFDKQRY